MSFSNLKVGLLVIIVSSLLAAFQNCGGEFLSKSSSKENLSNQTSFPPSGGPISGPSTGETAVESENLTVGWTDFEAHADTQIFYVSSSSGSDSNDGKSKDKAFKSIAMGLTALKLRANEATDKKRPDWLLLKSGDVWEERIQLYPNSLQGGISKKFPLLFSSYGEGERPIMTWVKSSPVVSYGYYGDNWPNTKAAHGSHYAFVGIEFYNPKKDPKSNRYSTDNASTQFFWLRGGSDILIEDCKFNYVSMGFDNYSNYHVEDVRVRRSLFLDNYGFYDGQNDESFKHSYGIYMNGVTKILLEENIFDHNGWNEDIATAEPTIYNHNVYLNTKTYDVTALRNISLRASADGIKFRGGANAEDNLFIKNGVGMSINGYKNSSVPQFFYNNVVLQGGDQPLAGKAGTFGGNPRRMGMTIGRIDEGFFDYKGNIVAHTEKGNIPFSDLCYENTSCITGNIVYNWGSFENTPGSFPDPNRNIEAYMSSLGLEPSLDAFIAQVRKQSRKNWKVDFTATAVNNYIRVGFGLPKIELDTSP